MSYKLVFETALARVSILLLLRNGEQAPMGGKVAMYSSIKRIASMSSIQNLFHIENSVFIILKKIIIFH